MEKEEKVAAEEIQTEFEPIRQLSEKSLAGLKQSIYGSTLDSMVRVWNQSHVNLNDMVTTVQTLRQISSQGDKKVAPWVKSMKGFDESIL